MFRKVIQLKHLPVNFSVCALSKCLLRKHCFLFPRNQKSLWLFRIILSAQTWLVREKVFTCFFLQYVSSTIYASSFWTRLKIHLNIYILFEFCLNSVAFCLFVCFYFLYVRDFELRVTTVKKKSRSQLLHSKMQLSNPCGARTSRFSGWYHF